MQAYRIRPGSTIDGLEKFETPSRELGPHEVRIGVRAVSLNFRDLMIAGGFYPLSSDRPVIPCSDGAGAVLEVGAAVKKFRAGDRVAGIFFPDWIEGGVSPEKIGGALGGETDGMLREEVILPESAVVAIPVHLSFAEAAALPCAAVTAWNALFSAGALIPGSSVLILGTGGVSVTALQLAKAAGLRAIVTSSSDEKLERVRQLGADETINYKTHPEWQTEVLRLTGGRGVDLALEVGGTDTMARSMASTRTGGAVAVIGGVSGFAGGAEIIPLIFGAKRVLGIFVGSREMFENLNRFIGVAKIKPVIDRTFAFDQAKEAYAHLSGGGHFGKVVITLD